MRNLLNTLVETARENARLMLYVAVASGLVAGTVALLSAFTGMARESLVSF